MSMNNIVRHPALWISAAALVGVLAFQAGRANPTLSLTSRNSPVITRPAGLFNESGSMPSVSPSLRQLDTQFADLVDRIGPSVVHIRTTMTQGGMERDLGQGSGVIIRPDGWIVTNDHVVNGSSSVTVILQNGREYKGRVIESDDDRNDIAVIKIDANDLPAAKFADSSQVRPGEYAIAVGAPFGLENTVTIGHISAVGRMNAAGSETGEIRTYASMIQTDAPINPGNSGGPLLNIDGEIVGINTSIYSGQSMFGGGGQSAGIGFSIPSNQVEFIADLLINNKQLKRGYLNIAMATLKPYELEEKGLPGGIRIEEVPSGGAGSKAGLKKDDIITKIGSYTIKDDQDLLNAMLRYAPGETVDVQFVRGGKTQNVSVKIDAQLVQQRPTYRRNLQAPEAVPNSPFQMPELPDMGDLFNRRNNSEDDSSNTPQSERKIGAPARLGVQFQDLDESARKTYQLPSGLSGVVVVSVEPKSVAALLGLKTGDVITQLGNKKINSGADLVKAVQSFKVGDSTMITFNRFSQGNSMQMSQTLQF